ncbi:molybdenum cofactor sulfurase isoform X11 [Cucumis melo var. makuwa]|uniref:Molybdenum cofactor sulfurase isoform X11 n=1 Tax=Cucumis melo var. makuwa TaxID=1194695 RepID=A0A5D3C9U2_CUCMM|nr:molybdenum cofactor sulfurase isoform X11 [Cucumis melo var. makuwa]
MKILLSTVMFRDRPRRNLRKEVRSLTTLPVFVQDSEPSQDQGVTNSSDSYIDTKMGKNNRVDTTVLEDMGENGSFDEIEVMVETIGDELNQITKLNTVRVLLFVVVNKDWPLHQLDVKDTLLDGDLEEEVCQELGLTVDDIMLFGDDTVEIIRLKKKMGDEFEIKGLGNLKYFLGMEVAISKEGISVSQRKQTFDLLAEIVNRIPQYLKTTLGKGLMFTKTNRRSIEVYTNSDWVGCVDRKSISGYCTFVWGNLVTVLKLSIGIVNNLVRHDRTKHSEIDRHFVKERLDNGSIRIPYVPYILSNQQTLCNEMGPVVSFNLRQPDGSWVGHREVEKLASLSGIQLRTGCFCNPGACAKYLGLSHSDLASNIAAGHVCWDDCDIINGKPTGAVRVSLGYMSTYEDVKGNANKIKEFRRISLFTSVYKIFAKVLVDRLREKQQRNSRKQFKRNPDQTNCRATVAAVAVVATAMDTVMEKLVQQLQKLLIYIVGPPLPPSVQPSGQDLSHAPPLFGSWPMCCHHFVSAPIPISSTRRQLSNAHTLPVICSPSCRQCPPIMDIHHKNY